LRPPAFLESLQVRAQAGQLGFFIHQLQARGGLALDQAPQGSDFALGGLAVELDLCDRRVQLRQRRRAAAAFHHGPLGPDDLQLRPGAIQRLTRGPIVHSGQRLAALDRVAFAHQDLAYHCRRPDRYRRAT
jgi:hypothetical protein